MKIVQILSHKAAVREGESLTSRWCTRLAETLGLGWRELTMMHRIRRVSSSRFVAPVEAAASYGNRWRRWLVGWCLTAKFRGEAHRDRVVPSPCMRYA